MARKKSTDSDKEKVKLDKKELEEIIVKLAKQGMNSTTIGETLKRTYGVASIKSKGAKIKKILAAAGIKEEIPHEIQNLLKRADRLKVHCGKNKQDKTAKRELQIISAKIRNKSGYFKRKGSLPKDWKY